jgi:hypothetical protein
MSKSIWCSLSSRSVETNAVSEASLPSHMELDGRKSATVASGLPMAIR